MPRSRRWPDQNLSPADQRDGDRGEAGTVTAELAVAMPAVVLLLAVLLVAATAAIGQVRCVDAARAAARAAARGDSVDVVLTAARREAPSGARIRLWRNATEVRVTVSTEVGAAGHGVPGIAVSGSAVASTEGGP